MDFGLDELFGHFFALLLLNVLFVHYHARDVKLIQIWDTLCRAKRYCGLTDRTNTP